MKNLLNLVVSLLLLCVSSCNIAKIQSPDFILTNGKIFTADTTQLYVQALAVKGNLIMATGSNGDIEKLAAANTQRIDLQGKTVVPGFNDAHDHLGWGAPVGKSFSVEFSVPGPDKQAVLDSVGKLVKEAKTGQWINGMIGMTVFKDVSMRNSLDKLTPDHPVLLQVMWGHGMVLNSKALRLLEIPETAPDPLGGWYDRKPGTDSITGALYEYAQWPAWNAMSISEPDNLVKGIQSYARQQIQFGITTVQNMNSMVGENTIQIFSQANLPLRVRIIPFPGTTPQGRNLTTWKEDDLRPSPLTYLSGIKYLIDGTPFEETAMLKVPYANRPGWYGRLDMPIDTIWQVLKEAVEGNTQLMMHIVGDSSMAVVLSLMKQTASDEVWKRKRVRFEHNQTGWSTPAERQMIAEMGIVLAHTPQYGHQHLLRSLLDQGNIIAMAPDGLTNPFVNIMIVTTQQKDPKENITREEAVIAYTYGAAYAEFTEKEKGTLMPGMLADLAVLSQDIFTIPAKQLPATRSVLTMVDGKIVYEQPPAKTPMK